MSKIYGYWGNKSIESEFDYYDIISERDLFIKVNLFYFPISVIDNYSGTILNIFEEKILEFGQIQIFSTEVISESLSVDFDLIALIQDKMFNKGYLDKDYKLTEMGLNYFKNKKLIISTKDENFRCILPLIEEHIPYINYSDQIIQYNQISGNEYDGYKTGICRFEKSGKFSQREGVLIEKLNKYFVPKKRPTEKEIRNLIRKNKELANLQINNEEHINIPIGGEEIYFHYKIALIKNSGEIIISNGYHFNDSGLLDYVKYYYPTVIDELYKMANVNTNQNDETTVVENVVKNSSQLSKPREFVEGKERKNIVFANNKLLSDYYTAIELAFFKYLKNNPVEDTVLHDLALNGYDENADYIAKIYQNLFSKDVTNYQSLFKVSKNNIDNFKNEMLADMNVLLSLMILHARDFKDSLFSVLIKKYPDLISFLSKLKLYRNINLHDGERMISYDEIMKYYEYATCVIKIILPSNSGYTQNNVTNFSITDNERFNDVTLLSNKLGIDVYHRLDYYSQKKLLDIITLYRNRDAFNFVNTIYSLFQRILKNYATQYLKVNEIPFFYGKRFAIQFLNERDMFDTKCPDSLSTVRLEMFDKAMKLGNSSLGGYMLVVVNLAYRKVNFNETGDLSELDENDIKKNNEKLAEICKFIAEILNLRFHGNKVNLSLSKERFTEIYNKIFEIIVLIGEI